MTVVRPLLATCAIVAVTSSAQPTAQPLTLRIHDIQGIGPRSPYERQIVSTSGVITARRSNGFFIQSAVGAADADARTSEGLLVFTTTTPAATLTVGTVVMVTGRVIEFVPTADPNSPPLTEIGENPVIDVRSSGSTLPEPVTVTGAMLSPLGSHEGLEPLEGMRVRVGSLTLVSPTLGSINEGTGTATSNGVFYGVLTGTPRPFREPGIDVRDGVPASAPCCLPLFDGNPERLRVDSDGQPGAAPLDLATGSIVENLVGPLDYAFRSYTLLPDVASAPVVISRASPAPAPRVPAIDETTVASLNVQRLFDTTDEPGVSDVVLSPATFSARLAKLALYIRRTLRSPDILGVQEVENLPTLTALAATLNREAVRAGEPDPLYEAYLEEGNDPGGIDVGVLVKRSRVEVLDVRQVGRWTRWIAPVTGREELLNDRPPLVLVGRVAGPEGRRAVLSVIVNHLRSLVDISSPTDGPRVRAKRAAQAEYLADLVHEWQRADPGGRLVVLGDLNAFEVNDGYVDVVGTVRGHPAPREEVLLPTQDRVEPDLAETLSLLPRNERYSYVFDGTAQVLDHMLVSSKLLPEVTSVAYGRGNADAPEVWRNDPQRPERVSDHDGVLLYLRLGTR